MPARKPFNLFVYGTLMKPSVFRTVLGVRLVRRPEDSDGLTAYHARDAILSGYQKVSPDNTYQYAVPSPGGRIRGYLVGPLPAESMAALGKYEGRNYSRRRLRVQTEDGLEQAVVFVGNLEELQHSFGYAFRDPLKQEILLEEKIEAALQETEQQQLHTQQRLGRRAVRELHGPTIRDIVRKHFEGGGISDYAIRHALLDIPLPDTEPIRSDGEARALAKDYLTLVVRQVIFNELEDRVRQEFRYELDHLAHGTWYYDRTLSALMVLRHLNRAPVLMKNLVWDCLRDLHFETEHLVDFVRWAIGAADALWDPKAFRQHLQFIRNHMGRGYISLGAELEFSNIGHSVIRDPNGQSVRDFQYDGFLYFRDFALDALTWKLGGHIDDHRHKSSRARRRGFFEAALGNLSIEANLSKPLTSDPWLLSQLILETKRFFPIAPHSVHISLQLRSQHRPMQDRLLPLSAMKCLFALAGAPVRDASGRVRIERLAGDEIISRSDPPGMLFSEIRRRYSSESDEAHAALAAGDPGRYVQQFRFIRLSEEIEYEPLVMALKGLQVKLRPGTFLLPRQYASSPPHRRLFHRLLDWGEAPTPLRPREIDRFLKHVSDGLRTERRGRPAHDEVYIAWALNQLRRMLVSFNALVEGRPEHPQPAPHLGHNGLRATGDLQS